MEVSGKRAEFVPEQCEPCQIKRKCSQADGYCKDCDENMCITCFQNHAMGKLCRNHVLSTIGQCLLDGTAKARSIEKCKTHTSEYIKYYCPKHDIVTCGDCNVTDHTGCKLEFISVLAKKFENHSEFKDIMKTLEKLEVEQKECKKRLASNRHKNKAFLDTALSEIKIFRKEINDHLDHAEREIVSEANKMSKEIEELLSKLEKMTLVAEQEISDLRNNLDSKIIKGEKLFIRTREYKSKLSKLGGNIAYMMTKNVLKGFSFEQEKQLSEMIRSSVKLGCLRMDTASEEAPAVTQKMRQPIESRRPVLKGRAEKHVEAKQEFIPSASSTRFLDHDQQTLCKEHSSEKFTEDMVKELFMKEEALQAQHQVSHLGAVGLQAQEEAKYDGSNRETYICATLDCEWQHADDPLGIPRRQPRARHGSGYYQDL